MACPPLNVLLRIMRDDHYEGKELSDPEIRAMFTLDWLLQSEWYAEFLKRRQAGEIALWHRHVNYLEEFLSRQTHASEAERLNIPARLRLARKTLKKVKSAEYVESFR